MSVEGSIVAGKAADRDGDLDAALAHYESALRAIPSCADAPGCAADLFRWIGRIRRQRSEMELAIEAYEVSLAVAEAHGDDIRIADALNSLGILEQSNGNLSVAQARYQRARALADRAGEDSLVAMLDQNLATLANIRGDLQEALASYASALERLESIGHTESAATVLANMGITHVDRGDWSAASRCLDSAQALAERLRDSNLLALVAMNRAELHLRQGRLVDARDSCDRAFETYSRLRSGSGRGEALKLYGVIARESRKPFLAETHFRSALELARSAGDPLLEAEVEAERAVLLLEQEENREALRALNNAHRLFAELEARRELFDLDRRLDRLEETYLEVVERWGASIEAKDEYTAGHCERVAEYACLLASAVGFQGRDLVWFRMGGFLHDVGKTAVPVEVLNKPGKLTAEEWSVMQSHTTVGYDIVRELNFPWDIAPLVRSHHEKWNGTGYPDGLAGEAIPLAARILCLADVYDALTTARSYRGALSHEEAIAIMEREGDAFDPELFRLFRPLMDARRPAGRPRSRRPVPAARATTSQR